MSQTKYVIVEVSRRGNPVAVYMNGPMFTYCPKGMMQIFRLVSPANVLKIPGVRKTKEAVVDIRRGPACRTGFVKGNRLMLMSASEWNRFRKSIKMLGD